MKVRDLDLSDSPQNLAHAELGLPPLERQPQHPIILGAMWVTIISLLALVAAGVLSVFSGTAAAGIDTIEAALRDPLLWQSIAVGFFAQAVDGALGMAYGITSTSFLLAAGVSPALATASVHMAEVFTTGLSGVAHARFGNVDKELFLRLLIPGIIGSLAGAIVVTQVDAAIIKPVVSAYLLLMGLYVLSKAFRTRKIEQSARRPRHVAKLALVGGFVDTSGGGGWGPVVTTSLVSAGHDPRTTIGSVNFAEFFLTVVSAASLFVLVDESIWHAVIGLIIGGLFAAPLAALLCRRIAPTKLLILIGLLISAISLINLVRVL